LTIDFSKNLDAQENRKSLKHNNANVFYFACNIYRLLEYNDSDS